MSISGRIKSASKNFIEYESSLKIPEDIAVLSPRSTAPGWLRIKDNDKVSIHLVNNIATTPRKIIPLTNFPFVPKAGSLFDIDTKVDFSQGIEIKIKKGGSAGLVRFTGEAKKLDNVYNGYWILFKNEARRIKKYANNECILDFPFNSDNIPSENDQILLLPHFFNDYIILGLDFTNFLGMDFSSLIDSVGGTYTFTSSSCFSSSCCLVILITLFMVIQSNDDIRSKRGNGKGLFIPGIGQMGSSQPLIVQLPMQTKPYPYMDSPFPRDT